MNTTRPLSTFKTEGVLPAPLPDGWLDRMAHRARRWISWRPDTLTRYRADAVIVERAAAGHEGATDAELHAWLRERVADLRRRPRQDLMLAWLGGLVAASSRLNGYQAHVEQIMGALALRDGWLVEMATGEGKTLVAGFAVLLHAASGRRSHVLTANDYLAARDRDFLAPLAAVCGLEAGCVTGQMPADARRLEYAKPVVFSTGKEVLADFLRDRLALGPESSPLLRLARAVSGTGRPAPLLLPPLDAVIVDEADHLLIDEAVTPLIISQKVENPKLAAAVQAADRLVRTFVRGRDYEVDEQRREARLLPAGMARILEVKSDFPDEWNSLARRVELMETALQARAAFHRDRQYVVLDGKIVIVDESTGRLMPDRQWQMGLHQAVEAKEGLLPGAPTETAARMSFQRFFRLYPHLSGLTGTASEARSELWDIYQLKVLKVPTHRPCLREDLGTSHFGGAAEKWEAIASDAKRIHATGRPVLVGTRSVAASETAREALVAVGLEPVVLNAVEHAREAEIVARAGEPGAVTIATNMAGRGTDIRLAAGVAAAGGLHVILTEKHESRRVDRQLAGRAARQGDPGSVRAFVSADDDLLAARWPLLVLTMLRRLLVVWPGAGRLLARRLTSQSQRRATRRAASRRRALLRSDHQLEESLGLGGGQD